MGAGALADGVVALEAALREQICSAAGGEDLQIVHEEYAGARAVVTSLWKVSDLDTQVLMERFYENLLKRKMGKLEALREAQLSFLKGNLQRLEAEIELEMQENTLVLTSPEEIIGSHAHRHFLARWWVNGKPFIPERESEVLREETGGMSNASKSLRLRLDFDPARLGAKKGYAIGLQLLYVDQGWEYVSEDRLERPLEQEGQCRVLSTNRIDFISP